MPLSPVSRHSLRFFRFVLTQAVVKSPVGGDYLSMQCRQHLEERGIEIIPPYMVASKELAKADDPPIWRRRFPLPKMADSWHNHMVKEVMQDFQASVLQVSDTLYDEEVVKTMPAIHYEFPNGYHRDFGVERFKIPEPLFNPTTGAKAGIQPILGVGPLVTTSVGMCDIDIRPVSVTDRGTVCAGLTCVVLGHVRKCCCYWGEFEFARVHGTLESRFGCENTPGELDGGVSCL